MWLILHQSDLPEKVVFILTPNRAHKKFPHTQGVLGVTYLLCRRGNKRKHSVELSVLSLWCFVFFFLYFTGINTWKKIVRCPDAHFCGDNRALVRYKQSWGFMFQVTPLLPKDFHPLTIQNMLGLNRFYPSLIFFKPFECQGVLLKTRWSWTMPTPLPKRMSSLLTWCPGPSSCSFPSISMAT